MGAEIYSPADDMVTPGFASPIRAYHDGLCRMKKSHDVSDLEQTGLDSLGVLDVDLSLGPDPFGLRAFDESLPNSRMLPGSGPCDLRVLIPDAGLGDTGFHDVVIENLLGTSVWRSRHVTPADVIGLRQRWPKAVFYVMKERCLELEEMRRQAFVGHNPAYRYSGPGYCPVCKTKSEVALNTRVSQSIPAWTVPRDFWTRALQPEISGIAVDVMLFHKSGRKLVHTYRVYQDPFPHLALREGWISKLISIANRAMVIAKLTKLRIAIPALGYNPGEVPSFCFPDTTDVHLKPAAKRVTFAAVDNVGGDPASPSPTEKAATPSPDAELSEPREGSTLPPPGFTPFVWPEAEWNDNGDLQRDPGLKFVASWSAKLKEEEMSSPPPLEPMSPDLVPMSSGSELLAHRKWTPSFRSWWTRHDQYGGARPTCSPIHAPTVGVPHRVRNSCLKTL